MSILSDHSAISKEPRPSSSPLAIFSLLLANLLPLASVWRGEADVFFLMLLYWFESLVIGFFTVLKMMKTGGSSFDVPFFMMHYGLFMFVHLIFLCVFFFSWPIALLSLFVVAASLFVSHLISYYSNFILNGEFKSISSDDLFWRPYPRIIVMHLVVIFGGMIALSTGESKNALALLIILKTLADLAVHIFQHRKA